MAICTHKNISTMGPCIADPTWQIAYFCKDCGTNWSHTHKHNLVATGIVKFGEITQSSYELYACTMCPYMEGGKTITKKEFI